MFVLPSSWPTSLNVDQINVNYPFIFSLQLNSIQVQTLDPLCRNIDCELQSKKQVITELTNFQIKNLINRNGSI